MMRTLSRCIHTVQVAIKFYQDKAAFAKEQQVYGNPQLQKMMPRALAVDDNASAAACTPYGYVFPAFTVTECGESLDEWARCHNADTDFVTILQVNVPPFDILLRTRQLASNVCIPFDTGTLPGYVCAGPDHVHVPQWGCSCCSCRAAHLQDFLAIGICVRTRRVQLIDSSSHASDVVQSQA